MLIAARAVQGVGAALVAPLTLTLLSAAVPATRRGRSRRKGNKPLADAIRTNL